MEHRLVFSTWLSFLVTVAVCQTTDSSYYEQDVAVQQMDREEWRKATEGLDFTEWPEEEEEKEVSEERDTSSDGENLLAISNIFKYLIIGLGLTLLVFIVVKLLGAESLFVRKDKKIKGEKVLYELDEIEENLMEAELQTPIQKAVDDENYALAIRLYYLAILREMTEKELLRWKKEKTNFEYLLELGNHPLRSEFKEVTRIFERVWYREAPLSRNDFSQFQPKFKELLNKVESQSVPSGT